MTYEKIKDEIFGNVPLHKKKISWFELYFCNREEFFIYSKKKQALSLEALNFFDLSQQRLEHECEKISIMYFRKLKFIQILQEFCDKKNSKIDENIICNNVAVDKEKTDSHSNNISSDIINNTKIIPKLIAKYEKRVPYERVIELVDEIIWYIQYYDSENIHYRQYTAKNLSVNKRKISITKIDMDDKIQYYYFDGIDQKTINSIEELENKILLKKPVEFPVQYRINTPEDDVLKQKKEEETKRKKLEKKQRRVRAEERHRQKQAEKNKKRKQEKEQMQKKFEEKQKEQERRKKQWEEYEKQLHIIKAQESRQIEIEEINVKPNIDVKDFVVRNTILKCVHNEHDIEDIVAELGVIDKKCEEQKIKVNAGYCKKCKIFFILESTYENIRNRGIPMCRISDAKTYFKSATVNGMHLAQESILMQYGYNVNQQEGLTSSRRQKILAVLIDKNVMKKSEIISYLDFFISRRKDSKFQIAVSKWEADREFVEEYKIGEYHRYGINAIYRR